MIKQKSSSARHSPIAHGPGGRDEHRLEVMRRPSIGIIIDGMLPKSMANTLSVSTRKLALTPMRCVKHTDAASGIAARAALVAFTGRHSRMSAYRARMKQPIHYDRSARFNAAHSCAADARHLLECYRQAWRVLKRMKTKIAARSLRRGDFAVVVTASVRRLRCSPIGA